LVVDYSQTKEKEGDVDQMGNKGQQLIKRPHLFYETLFSTNI
jgi:hypothetical protein